MTISGQAKSSLYPLTLHNAGQFYHEELFDQSVTFNKWVPLSCDDVHFLLSYKEIYGNDPKISGAPDGGPFFFYNHPINFVSVRGRCLNAQYKELKENFLQWTLTVNDGSGRSVQAVKFISGFTGLGVKYKNACREITGKFVRVNGFLQINRIHGFREVKICDLCVAASCLKDEMLFCDETVSLRKNVLMKPWKIKDHRAWKNERRLNGVDMQKSITVSSDSKAAWSQLQYCSLHRYDSVLSRKKHQSFRLGVKKSSVHEDLSVIEKINNEKHNLKSGFSDLPNYLALSTTPHKEAAEKFLGHLTELDVDYENMDDSKPSTDRDLSKHIKYFEEFLLDICTKKTSYQVAVDQQLLDFCVIICKLVHPSETITPELIETFISKRMRELVKKGFVIALNGSRTATYVANYQKAGTWNIGKNFVDPIADEVRKGKKKSFVLLDIQRRLERHKLDRDLLLSIINETLADDETFEWEWRKKKAWFIAGRRNTEGPAT